MNTSRNLDDPEQIKLLKLGPAYFLPKSIQMEQLMSYPIITLPQAQTQAIMDFMILVNICRVYQIL